MGLVYSRSIFIATLWGAWCTTIGTAWALPMLGPVTAKLSFVARSATLGVGYTWGHGVLTYAGRHYPFDVVGGSAGAIGFSLEKSVGSVYNLQRVEDFVGVYWSLSGEATVGRGVCSSIMENEEGVRIRLEGHCVGGRIAASPSRLTIKWDKPMNNHHGFHTVASRKTP
ncbi:MAG: hypothetical protein IJ934_03410 [Acetobacter sp.]|nr:hypothetical protein [Acetobacter sp.]MBR2124212.1 hypothetical protein [Acetobacter sp.]